VKLQRIFALAAGAVLALSACDGDGTGSGDLGTFDAQVSGDVNAGFSGRAASGGSPGGQDVLALQDFDDNTDIVFVHIDDFFSEGTWPIEDASVNDPTSGIAAGLFLGNRVFIATDGVIDIDDASSDGLEGTFEFDAVEVDPLNGDILDDFVLVEGVFSSDFQSSLSRGPTAEITRIGGGGLR
jgi:hypothetical protein